MNLFLLSLMCLRCIFVCAEEEHQHSWEWSGIFSIDQANNYIWSAEKTDGNYAEKSMKILVLVTNSANEDGLEEVEELAEQLFEGSAITVFAQNQTTITSGALHRMVFDDFSWASFFPLEFTNSGYWAVFAEHDPSEFESSFHFFRDTTGEDIDPLFESSHSSETADNQRIGLTIGACCVVWLCTFAGLITLIVPWKSHNTSWMLLYGNMFAAGALLSAAFCLVLPEANHLIGTADITESTASGYWAMMVIVGFLLPLIFDLLMDSYAHLHKQPIEANHDQHTVESNSQNIVKVEDGGANEIAAKNLDTYSENGGTEEDEKVDLQSTQQRILFAVIVGDFLHNFADGLFIGAAFKSCSVSVGWTVASSTIFHELVQEIADFLTLTGPAKFSLGVALLFNFCSGISVLLGGVTIALTDVSDFGVGMVLSLGAGQYLYVATVELFPAIRNHHHHHIHQHEYTPTEKPKETSDGPTVSERWIALACFAFAATATGLVLLDHEHCESGSGDGHAH